MSDPRTRKEDVAALGRGRNAVAIWQARFGQDVTDEAFYRASAHLPDTAPRGMTIRAMRAPSRAHGPILGTSFMGGTVQHDRSLSTWISVILAGAFASGCALHHHGVVSVREDIRSGVQTDLAVVGALDLRQPTNQPSLQSVEATRVLVGQIDLPNASEHVSPEDVATMLATPETIRGHAKELAQLERRVGHRYVLAGALVTVPVDETRRWVAEVSGTYMLVEIPFTYAHSPAAPYVAVALRVVDLESAEVIAESFEISPHCADGRFDEKYVASALLSLGLRRSEKTSAQEAGR